MHNSTTRRSRSLFLMVPPFEREVPPTYRGSSSAADMNRSVVQPVAAFARYIGIDYSGAQTPTASLKGLRVYMADRSSSPVEVMPPAGPRKYWTRRGIAEWLVNWETNPPS